jgi:hypothetical protein
MNTYQKPLLALALALSVGSVCAQSAGGAEGGGPTFSKDNFQSWLNDHSAKNNGRISRQDYMKESSRRWDKMDTTKRGLTTDQINDMYYPGAKMGGPTATAPNEKKGIP